MKKKDIIQIAVAAVILSIAGVFIYSQLVGNKDNKGVVVEVVTSIPTSMDSDGVSKLTDSTINRDFYAEPNLKSGIGNNQPFGQ